MKFLKYILAIISILVVVFFLMGLFKPQLSYECEIWVEKPLAESWAVSQDDEKMPEWIIGFQKMEPILGVSGTVGAVSDIYIISNGEEMIIRETITEIVPNESITMHFTSDFMDMDYKFSIRVIDGKTKISTQTTAVGKGLISKSIIALLGNSIKAQEQTNLSYLKKTIEQNTKNYFYMNDAIIKIDQNSE